MSKVFFDVGISLDGFMTGENRGPHNPIGDNGTTIHEWMFNQHTFLKMSGKGQGIKEGINNQLIEDTVTRIGANIMGKRMFEEGAKHWKEPDVTQYKVRGKKVDL